MSLNTLNTDELVQMVQLSTGPTELEVALANKLLAAQKVLQDLSNIIDPEL